MTLLRIQECGGRWMRFFKCFLTWDEWIAVNKTTMLPSDHPASVCAGLLIGHTKNFYPPSGLCSPSLFARQALHGILARCCFHGHISYRITGDILTIKKNICRKQQGLSNWKCFPSTLYFIPRRQIQDSVIRLKPFPLLTLFASGFVKHADLQIC